MFFFFFSDFGVCYFSVNVLWLPYLEAFELMFVMCVTFLKGNPNFGAHGVLLL